MLIETRKGVIGMFENMNFQAFHEGYQRFKNTKEYEARKKQTQFVEVAQLVISEVLKKNDLLNEDLTAFILMFSYNCRQETFYKYLLRTIQNNDQRELIFKRFISLGVTGYTAIGRAAIKGLGEDQLKAVRTFLTDVQSSKTSQHIIEAWTKYVAQKVPYVTVGIYSPWLYYMKPEICPVLTGPTRKYLMKNGWDGKYDSAVILFSRLNENTGEKDLGLLDSYISNLMESEETILFEIPSMSLLEKKKQIILFGPPGTGKTFITKEIALSAAMASTKKTENE